MASSSDHQSLRMSMRGLLLALGLVLLLAFGALACAAEDGADPTAQTDAVTAEPATTVPRASPAPVASPTPDPTPAVTPDATPTTAPTPTREPTPMPTRVPDPKPTPPSAPERRCVQIVDFAEPGAGQGWFIVNDGVMGGRSAGSAEVTADGTAIFEGEINTNGGGFSSIRAPIEPGALSDTVVLRIQARNLDGRSYEFLVDDAQPGRDRRISHFGPIPLTGTGEWETVEVRFDTLAPRIFGRSVESPPVDPALISGVGIILSDGIDGPFQLEIASMHACETASESETEA